MAPRSPALFLLLFATFGCAPKVAFEVPAAPAVSINTVTIRVKSADRSCQMLADKVADRIGQVQGMQVDPRADASLTLYGCTSTLLPAEDGTTIGSTAAIATLNDRAGVVHLLGSARGTFPQRTRSRTALQRMNQQAAADVVEQIAPLPVVVRRRVYDNADEGSAKALLTRAVRAEQEGHLATALHYAREAHELRPRPERARYVAELTRRLSRTE